MIAKEAIVRRRLWILYLCTAVVAGLFIVSGIQKLLVLNSADSTTLFETMLKTKSQRIAFCVAEIGLGVWLLLSLRNALPRFIATLVLCAFAGALFAETKKETPKACGCSGATAVLQRSKPDDLRFELSLKAGQNLLLAAASGCSALFLLRARRVSEMFIEVRHEQAVAQA